MAEPPQIPVPAEIRFESFQLSLKAFPMKYPPPKQVSRVKIITTSDIFPTFRTVVILRESPKRIMANLSSFFDVNLIPVEKILVFLMKQFIIIPINIAITAEPIRCRPIALSKKCSATQATAATAVCFYTLFEVNKNIKRLTEAVDRLEKRIERLEERIFKEATS